MLDLPSAEQIAHDFNNAAFMLDQLSEDLRHVMEVDVALCNEIGFNFFIQFGQARSAVTYAKFGKISQELALRTIRTFLSSNSSNIATVRQVCKEGEGE